MKRATLLITSLSTLATISCFFLHRLKSMEVSPILEVWSLVLPKDPISSYPPKLATKYAHIVPASRVVKKVAFISTTDIFNLEPRICSVVPNKLFKCFRVFFTNSCFCFLFCQVGREARCSNFEYYDKQEPHSFFYLF